MKRENNARKTGAGRAVQTPIQPVLINYCRTTIGRPYHPLVFMRPEKRASQPTTPVW
ncbi:hypothetical protein MKQ70_14045 [Chitinophaga sedimenti]|uniref:hypothetical protein n=1 Tax=Chitinophaga sedimenti TaxID=2033606 RepID=UPI0020042BA1|nr:hypothetical protein [Chitinophaga sedimenti]MCK7556080.1 hypothetical protein [Chitinophaga sedimenti]